MNEISPGEILIKTLHYWWILAVLTILGGVLGWIISLFQPPIYEAAAIFEVSLDQQQLVRDGLVTIDQLPMGVAAQDVFFTPAADIFFAPDIKARFIQDAISRGITLDKNDFPSNIFHLDRQILRWFVTVRSHDPVVAANLANLWVADVYPALLEVRAHTAEAVSLELQRNSIQGCFSEMDFASANHCAGTTFAGAADLDEYLKTLEQKAAAERQAGRGVDPALGFVVGNPAEPPASPILYSGAGIIFAGSIFGLLVGSLVLKLLPGPVQRK